MKININKKLTLIETMMFISSVCDNCFEIAEDGTDVTYLPRFKDPAMCESIAIYYADDYSPTDDIEKNYAEYSTIDIDNLFANNDQFAGICKAINEEIDFRKEKLLRKSPLDELLGEITKVVSGLSSNFDMATIGEIAKKFSTLENIDEKSMVTAILDSQKKPKKAPADRKPRAKKPKVETLTEA